MILDPKTPLKTKILVLFAKSGATTFYSPLRGGDVTRPLLQGDTLAPFLFVIVLDYALRKALDGKEEDLGFTITPRKSRRHPKEAIADLDFADDISLLSDQIEEAQQLLFSVERECKKVGLGLNGPKTKYLAYNIEEQQPLQTLDGTTLEQKNDF